MNDPYALLMAAALAVGCQMMLDQRATGGLQLVPQMLPLLHSPWSVVAVRLPVHSQQQQDAGTVCLCRVVMAGAAGASQDRRHLQWAAAGHTMQLLRALEYVCQQPSLQPHWRCHYRRVQGFGAAVVKRCRPVAQVAANAPRPVQHRRTWNGGKLPQPCASRPNVTLPEKQ